MNNQVTKNRLDTLTKKEAIEVVNYLSTKWLLKLEDLWD